MSEAVCPPTEQEYEIFRLVMIVRQSHREVAADWQLPPEAVRGIVERVMKYLIEALSAETPEYLQGRLRLARYLATERMEHLLFEAQ